MRSPTIHEFVAAAYRADPHGELIVQDGRVYLVDEKYDLNVSEQELRKRTWEAFQRALEETFSDKRINKICADYPFSSDNERDWFQIKEPYPALMRRHVEIFGVGSANIHIDDLLEQGNPSDLTPGQLHSAYIQADPLHYLGETSDPTSLRAGPSDFAQYLWIPQVAKDRKRVNLYQGVENLNWHAYLQRLSMAIIGCEPKVGTLIPAPIGGGRVDYYKVHKIIPAKGLYAVALKPVSKFSKLQKMVLFRQTRTSLNEMDTIHSWINNVEKNIGQTGYEAAQKQLQSLMEDPDFCRKDEKVVVSAYSLGGAHCGHFCREFWRRISEAVFFNDVSNSDLKVAEGLADEINQLPPDTLGPNVTIYRAISSKDGMIGDWAHFSGRKHVFWGIKHPGTSVQVKSFILPDLTPPRDIATWGKFHGWRYLDEGDGNPYEKYEVNVYRGRTLVDRELDNHQRGEAIKRFEEMRLSLGTKVLYDVLNIGFRILDFSLRFFGIPILKTSE